MSPAFGSSELLSRPKFTWDLKNAARMDGRLPQERYHSAVGHWKPFNEKLIDGHNSKITTDIQDIVLQPQLFGRAADLCKKLSDEEIQAPDGALAIAELIHKSDLPTFLTDTFGKFQLLLITRRRENESIRKFEVRFDAQVCRYNSASSSNKLSPSLVAFLLLEKAILMQINMYLFWLVQHPDQWINQLVPQAR